jgi:hypothetical protein
VGFEYLLFVIFISSSTGNIRFYVPTAFNSSTDEKKTGGFCTKKSILAMVATRSSFSNLQIII